MCGRHSVSVGVSAFTWRAAFFKFEIKQLVWIDTLLFHLTLDRTIDISIIMYMLWKDQAPFYRHFMPNVIFAIFGSSCYDRTRHFTYYRVFQIGMRLNRMQKHRMQMLLFCSGDDKLIVAVIWNVKRILKRNIRRNGHELKSVIFVIKLGIELWIVTDWTATNVWAVDHPRSAWTLTLWIFVQKENGTFFIVISILKISTLS